MENMKETSIKLAELIKKRRQEKGLTQEQLAEIAKIDYKHIQNIESLKRINDPKLSTLRKLAKALEIPITNTIVKLIQMRSMSYFSRTPIPLFSFSSRFTYCFSQDLFRSRNGNKVNMVGHQTVSPYLHIAAFAPLRQQGDGDICPVVSLSKKGLLPSIIALCYRMGETLSNYSTYPRHGQTILSQISLVNN